MIFREDDPANEMYVVKSGRVTISKKILGIMVTLAELGEGESFGEMSLLDQGPRSATAVAAGSVVAVAYDRRALKEQVRTDSDFALTMLETFSKRLRKVDHELASLVSVGRLPAEDAAKLVRHLSS
jgi:CRP/FNR family cyclic AMP-dependent transcriptional regulator